MWFWYALACAGVSAISVTYNKRVLNKQIRASTLSWSLFAFSIIPTFLLALKFGIPRLNPYFFLIVLGIGIIFSISKTLALSIFKKVSLSEVYPIQALGPIVNYLLALFLLSENLKTTALGGIFVAVVGIYILNLNPQEKNIFHPFRYFINNKSCLLYLVVILLSSLTAILEKTAIRNTNISNMFYFTFWENLSLSFFTLLYVLRYNQIGRASCRERV